MKKTYLLNLDRDLVYWGATEVHPTDASEDLPLSNGIVILDHAPDNAPGKYRWDPATAALHPLPLSQQKAAPGVPDLERAFDALCEWLSDNNQVALPALLAEWRAAYQKTIDSKKIID